MLILAAATMAVFLAGAASWVVSGGPAPHGLLRAGLLDAAAVAMMTLALIVATGATRRALAAR